MVKQKLTKKQVEMIRKDTEYFDKVDKEQLELNLRYLEALAKKLDREGV